MKDKKTTSKQLQVTDLRVLVAKTLHGLSVYRVFIFFLLVATFYGYIVWRINVYSNAPASQSEETAQTTKQPRVDPVTVQKIQNLQDNSVSVQAIFKQARQNPFQE